MEDTRADTNTTGANYRQTVPSDDSWVSVWARKAKEGFATRGWREFADLSRKSMEGLWYTEQSDESCAEQWREKIPGNGDRGRGLSL